MRTVLFICTGNTCRSPMAEAIARHHLDQGLIANPADIFIASAGVGALDGARTTPETVNTLSQMGIEYSGKSKRLTDPMIRRADLIFCMTAQQQIAARELVADSPPDMDKIVLLEPDNDIEDPIGMGQEAYNALGRRLEKLIPRRLKETLHNALNHKF